MVLFTLTDFLLLRTPRIVGSSLSSSGKPCARIGSDGRATSNHPLAFHDRKNRWQATFPPYGSAGSGSGAFGASSGSFLRLRPGRSARRLFTQPWWSRQWPWIF